MNLSQTDYKKIINYYNLSKSNNKSNKELAEDVLALKLCKCIKKTRPNRHNNENEKGAIALCRKAIFKNRGIDFFNFKCKKKQSFIHKKGTKKKLVKFRKKIGFNKTKKIKKIKKIKK